MRIIHTGDIHIGSPLKNLPTEKAQLRKTELLDGFRRLCVYAKDNGVTAVLIAGDLLDETKVTGQVKRQTLVFIADASPVLFFCVSGNHDWTGFDGEALPDNLYLFAQNRGAGSYYLGENVTVTGMDTKYFSTQNFQTLAFTPNTFNILLLHGDVYAEGSREYIPLDLLANKGVDYLALGHIHIPDVQSKPLDGRGRYRYCGCPEGRGFDEVGGRGFFLLDIAGGQIVAEHFLTLAKRAVSVKRVDIGGCQTYFDVENAVWGALQNERGENVVKIILCGEHEADLKKDISVLTSRLNERFFFAKVEDETRLKLHPEAYVNDLTERGEFVREVLRCGELDGLQAEILEVGLKALAGEDIDL